MLPRNQWNPAYTDAVLALGFRCIRAPSAPWGHEARPSGGRNAYCGAVPGWPTRTSASQPPPTTQWDEVLSPSGLCDVPASAFLRPFNPARRRALEPLRRARLRSGLRQAARHGRIFHLWWHPHNFSQHLSENVALLEQVLDEFDRLATSEGMQSLTMADVASRVAPTPSGRTGDPG